MLYCIGWFVWFKTIILCSSGLYYGKYSIVDFVRLFTKYWIYHDSYNSLHILYIQLIIISLQWSFLAGACTFTFQPKLDASYNAGQPCWFKLCYKSYSSCGCGDAYERKWIWMVILKAVHLYEKRFLKINCFVSQSISLSKTNTFIGKFVHWSCKMLENIPYIQLIISFLQLPYITGVCTFKFSPKLDATYNAEQAC